VAYPTDRAYQTYLAFIIVSVWRNRRSTGSPPEPRAKTPEVFWTTPAST
jgi:hypothetical protein